MKRRYTVIEAAKVLGVGTDAVRKRVARGTVENERVDDAVYVWLDDGHDSGTTGRRDGGTNGDGAHLLDAYRDQLAALIQRVPELGAGADPPAPSEAHEDGARGPANGAGVPAASTAGSGGAQNGPERVGWWRRVFGG